jgi:glycosyltransferase involved in cell wall biosynthesis
MKKSFVRWILLIGGLVAPLAVVFLSVRNKKIHSSKPLMEKPFVIVVPSYNNSAYCEQNILSILNQQYENFRVIFIDDASQDDTFEKVQNFVERSPRKDKVALIKNWENQGSLKNLYTIIHTCADPEIVVRVDGDDFLAHPQVLKKLNKIYADPTIWMTYGNYLDYPSYKQKPNLCQKFPGSVIKNRRFRHYKWVTHHLQTFYAGLFKKISPEHLMRDGKFLPMAGDVAFVTSMLEMAAGHFHYVDEVLYLYNRSNPLNDHKTNLGLQSACESYVRAMTSYKQLEEPPYLQAEAIR